MTLRHIKTNLLLQLSTIKPKNDREKEILQHLMVKVYNLRLRDLPSLIFFLNQIQYEREVSSEFKETCRDLLKTLEKHKKQLLEGE